MHDRAAKAILVFGLESLGKIRTQSLHRGSERNGVLRAELIMETS